MNDVERKQIGAKDFIDGVMYEFGRSPSPFCVPAGLSVNEDLETKLSIYRIAALSYAIIAASLERESCVEFQRELEIRVAGSADEWTARALGGEIRKAVEDIRQLISSEQKATWAKDWFRALGIDVTNYVSATLFSLSVMNTVTSCLRTIARYEIVPP